MFHAEAAYNAFAAVQESGIASFMCRNKLVSKLMKFVKEIESLLSLEHASLPKELPPSGDPSMTVAYGCGPGSSGHHGCAAKLGTSVPDCGR